MAISFTALSLPTLMVKATCLYQPSVYNGTGTETRLNIVLSIDDTTRDQIARIESDLELGPSSCSVLKGSPQKVSLCVSWHLGVSMPRWMTRPVVGMSTRCPRSKTKGNGQQQDTGEIFDSGTGRGSGGTGVVVFLEWIWMTQPSMPVCHAAADAALRTGRRRRAPRRHRQQPAAGAQPGPTQLHPR